MRTSFGLLFGVLLLLVSACGKNESGVRCAPRPAQKGTRVLYVGPVAPNFPLAGESYLGTVEGTAPAGLLVRWDHLAPAPAAPLLQASATLERSSSCLPTREGRTVTYVGPQGPAVVNFPAPRLKYQGVVLSEFGTNRAEVRFAHGTFLVSSKDIR